MNILVDYRTFVIDTGTNLTRMFASLDRCGRGADFTKIRLLLVEPRSEHFTFGQSAENFGYRGVENENV